MTDVVAKPTSRETYAIAHSARCKLGMVADKPGRNLRFVLGHAFTLDNALFRVAEIEGMADIEPQTAKNALQANDDGPKQSTEKQEGQTGSLAGGVVKFDDDKTRPSNTKPNNNHKREGPQPISIPTPKVDLKATEDEVEGEAEDEDEDEDEDQPVYSDVEDDDTNSGGFGLTRFASASAEPPRMIPPSESESDEEDDEPTSPPSLPADFDILNLMEGEQDGDLGALYESIRGCPCHKHQDIKCKGMWEVKGSDDICKGKRLAIMKVDA